MVCAVGGHPGRSPQGTPPQAVTAEPIAAPPTTSHAEFTRQRSSRTALTSASRDGHGVHQRRGPELPRDHRHQRQRGDVDAVEERRRPAASGGGAAPAGR